MLSIFLCPPNHRLNKKERFLVFLVLLPLVAGLETMLVLTLYRAECT